MISNKLFNGISNENYDPHELISNCLNKNHKSQEELVSLLRINPIQVSNILLELKKEKKIYISKWENNNSQVTPIYHKGNFADAKITKDILLGANAQEKIKTNFDKNVHNILNSGSENCTDKLLAAFYTDQNPHIETPNRYLKSFKA